MIPYSTVTYSTISSAYVWPLPVYRWRSAPAADRIYSDTPSHNLRARGAPQNTNCVWYPTANADATPHIDEEIRTNESIYPPKEVRDKLFVDVTNSQSYVRKRTRSWTSVKTGQ